MFLPQVYGLALVMMIFTMLCWGSWVNTYKLCKGWRFELFYWDYVWGILICSLLISVTLGRTDPASPDSFFQSLRSADLSHMIWAVLSGVVFNLSNIFVVAAISIAGMAIGYSVGVGLALVVGATLNYVLKPVGNAWLLFGGIGLVCVAMVLVSLAHLKHSGGAKVSTTGILLSVVGGILMGLFYPILVKATMGEGRLGPYSVTFMFAVGMVLSNIPFNYAFMRHPVSGPPIQVKEYFTGGLRPHGWGLVGGLIWMAGTISNYVASYAQMVGPAAAYAIGQGSTMVGAAWGVFVWKEFRGATPSVKWLLALMFALFLIGLGCVALAPVLV